MPYKSKKKKVNYKKLKAITKQRKKAKKKIKKEVCDDAEFTSCQHCKSDVCAYNNTTRSSTTCIHSEYTKCLLKQHSTNCEKCGKYIEFHPERSADASIIFLCSSSTPCSHALCYDCGILYNLKTDTNAKMDIAQALTGESAEVGAESPEPASSVDGGSSDDDDTCNRDKHEHEHEQEKDIDADVGAISSVVPMAIMAEMMHGHGMDMATSTSKEVAVREQQKSDKQSSDAEGLIIGTMMALYLLKKVKSKNVPFFVLFAAISYLGMYFIPFALFLALLVGAVSVLIIARCNFVSTLYNDDFTELNVTIDLDLDEDIEYDVITKGWVRCDASLFL